jgi:signal transduction histidine kinase
MGERPPLRTALEVAVRVQDDEGPGFEELLGDLSATLVRATVDEIDNEIERLLQRIILGLGIDRGSVAEFEPATGILHVTHHWAREGVTTIAKHLNTSEALPWLAGKVLAGELVVVSRIEELPPEAAREVLNAEVTGTKSNVTVPLRIGGVIVGGVSFTTVFSERTWSKQDVQRFKLVAEVFGNALERKRAVAEILRLQEEMKQVSSVVMMGELTASLAHELNQPLGAILSNAQAARRMLGAQNPDLTEVRAALDDVIRDDARAVEIVQNVRALFRRDQPQKSLIDPKQVLIDVERILRHDAKMKKISLTVDLVSSLPPVVGDRTQLMQALINLVLNAFDAVSGEADGPRQVVLSASQAEAGHVRMAIRDSGKGIDPTMMPRLFDAFFTTKPTGMGMGLAIARSIIEQHSGRLWATQNGDRGATLQFVLPTEPDATN